MGFPKPTGPQAAYLTPPTPKASGNGAGFESGHWVHNSHSLIPGENRAENLDRDRGIPLPTTDGVRFCERRTPPMIRLKRGFVAKSLLDFGQNP